MYNLKYKHILVLLALLSSYGFSQETSTILYRVENQSNSRGNAEYLLPPVFINFNNEKNPELNQQNIRLMFQPDESGEKSQNLSWDINRIEKKRIYYFSSHQVTYNGKNWKGKVNIPYPWSSKVLPFIRQKSIRENVKDITQRRGNYTKKKDKNERYQELNIKLKRDVFSSTQNTNHTINLDNIPIKFYGPYSGSLAYTLSGKPISKTGYRIVASYLTPELDHEYIFLKSPDSLYTIDLKMYLASPSLFQKGWYIKISLPHSGEATWDQGSIDSQKYSIQNSNDSVKYSVLSATELIFRPPQDFRGNQYYTLESLPIRANDITSEARIKISISPDGDKFYEFGETSNSFKVNNPKLILPETEKSFITLFKRGDHLTIPDIVVNEGSIKIPENQIQRMRLSIPDSIHTTWAMVTGAPSESLYNYEIKSDRDIIFQSNIFNGSGRFTLKSAELQQSLKSMDHIYLDVIIDYVIESIRLPFTIPITIGQPNASIMEDNILLGSSNDPIIRQLYIMEDPNVTSLGVGDTVSYMLNDSGGVVFDSGKLSLVEFPIDQVRLGPLSSNDQAINFILERDLLPGDTIKISNLPLEIMDGESRIVHSIVKYQTVHGTTYSAEDQAHIEIVNINIDFEQTTEYFPKSQNAIEHLKLPNLTIHNDGSVDILHGKILQLNLESISDYNFTANQILIESQQNIDSQDVHVEKNKIFIEFPDGLQSQAFIKIDGISLQIPPDHTLFYKEHLVGTFGTKENNVISTNTITYGRPSFESPYVQKLVAGSQDCGLYTVACDFSNMPLTFEMMEDIILRLPGSLAINWDPNMNLSITNKAGENSLISPITSNNQKDVRIHLDRMTRNRLDIGEKFHINGLSLLSPIADQLKSFKINVSIDQGSTFAISVAPGKEIVSPLNRSAIDQQRVREDNFPFTVGREIEIGFTQPSRLRWAVGNREVKYSKADEFSSRNIMFYPEYEISPDRSKLTATIQYDIDNQPQDSERDEIKKKYQMMDYGVSVTLSQLAVETTTENSIDPDIYIRLNTLYGPMMFNRSHGMYDVDIKTVNAKVNVRIGLKPYPNNDFLINWYRYPNRYIPYLNIDQTDTIAFETDEFVEDLNRLRNELNRYFGIVDKDAYYDWVYWYYTAWYKKRMQDMRGASFSNYSLADYPQNTSTISEDIDRAIRHGYDIDILSASFPSPLDTTEVSRLRERAFKEARQLFTQGEFIKCEDILYENLDKPGMEGYLLVAYYTLLGQVASALNDQSEFYNRQLNRHESFECRMYTLARNALDTKHTRSRLLVWDKDIYSIIQNVDCDDIDLPLDDREEHPKNTVKFQSWQVTPSNPMRLSIVWLPTFTSRLYSLNYVVSHYPVIEKDENIAISYDSIQKDFEYFNDDIQVYGGNTYTIHFSEVGKPFKRSLLVASTTGLLAFWGSK